jgi:6-pyruvoyltetrahydropterin/6-carboxytetrahydropterin synthase
MGHKCGRMHGHTYEVELVLESPQLDHVGFVRDYGELAVFKHWLDSTFDHHLINETVPQPTAENMAHFIYNKASTLYHEVVAVRVSETGNTTAWFAPHSLPPLVMILDAIESLASEPHSNPDRRRLQAALRILA